LRARQVQAMPGALPPATNLARAEMMIQCQRQMIRPNSIPSLLIRSQSPPRKQRDCWIHFQRRFRAGRRLVEAWNQPAPTSYRTFDPIPPWIQ